MFLFQGFKIKLRVYRMSLMKCTTLRIKICENIQILVKFQKIILKILKFENARYRIWER